MTTETGKSAAFRCANHPDTETHLRCSRCGKPICVRCVIQTPVGGRCRECAALKKAPMFQVGPRRFAKAALYGGVAAVVGGFLWVQVGSLLGRSSLLGFSSLLLLFMGYVVGEAVSRGADRRVSRGLVVMAGVLTVLAVAVGPALVELINLLTVPAPLALKLGMAVNVGVASVLRMALGNLFGLLFLVLAVVIATSRVR